jgi:hypothetical protein
MLEPHCRTDREKTVFGVKIDGVEVAQINIDAIMQTSDSHCGAVATSGREEPYVICRSDFYLKLA